MPSNRRYVTIRHVETAAMVGLISVRMPSYIVFGRVIAATSSKARITRGALDFFSGTS